jgi:hypothetical protein
MPVFTEEGLLSRDRRRLREGLRRPADLPGTKPGTIGSRPEPARPQKKAENLDNCEVSGLANTPTGSRTPVFGLRTRRPGPLDDGGVKIFLAGSAHESSKVQSPPIHPARPAQTTGAAQAVGPPTATGRTTRRRPLPPSPQPISHPRRSATSAHDKTHHGRHQRREGRRHPSPP